MGGGGLTPPPPPPMFRHICCQKALCISDYYKHAHVHFTQLLAHVHTTFAHQGEIWTLPREGGVHVGISIKECVSEMCIGF